MHTSLCNVETALAPQRTGVQVLHEPQKTVPDVHPPPKNPDYAREMPQEPRAVTSFSLTFSLDIYIFLSPVAFHFLCSGPTKHP